MPDQARIPSDVQPSLDTEYFIHGNSPESGTVCAKQGDYLQLDTKTGFPADPEGLDTSGRKLTITSRGTGYWDFATDHQNVNFDGIERFNHVDIVAVAADGGRYANPRVRVFDAETNELKFELPPEVTYGEGYRQGIRVATGDINNDGLPDVVTVPGRLMAPEVMVFNGAPIPGLAPGDRKITSMTIPAGQTYGDAFIYGLEVAVGDVVGDCLDDIILVPSRGASEVKVFENRLAQPEVYCQWASPYAVRSFNAFGDYPSFIGGATLATGDLDGDADGSDQEEIIVASGSGMPGLIRVFNVAVDAPVYGPVRQINDPDASHRGGLNVASGDVNGDGIDDIVTGAGNAGNGWVRIYDGRTNPPDESTTPVPPLEGDANGDGIVDSADLDVIRAYWCQTVSAGDSSQGDLTGDGMVNSADLDLIRGNWGAVSSVPAAPAPYVEASFQAFTDASMSAPTRVVVRDIDGDGRAEVFAAQGADGRNDYQVRKFRALEGRLVDTIFADCPDFDGGGVFLG